MARTPVLERGFSLKMLGAIFVAMVIFFVWVTYAFFTKAFVDYDNVTLTTDTTGVNLPRNADVKLRGMIVGEVRKTRIDGDGVELTLGMNPRLIRDVPKGVTAQLVPKTLFGEKYVALIPPTADDGQKLQAGDVITKADVPIEVETLLNDLYPLLEAVDPASLSYTLSAVSTALDGRGTELGETLVTLNSYLKKVNPEVPQLVTDLTKLGTVSDAYAAALPDLGRVLRNTVVTGNTIVAKRAQLAAFLDEGTRLGDTLTAFTKENGDNLVRLAGETRPVLEMVGDYSSTFPCFLKSMSTIIPRLDSAFRGGTLHIDVKLIPQPDAYRVDENTNVSKADVDRASSGPSATNGKDIDASNAATPTCLDLNEINKGRAQQERLSSQDNPFAVPADVYKLVGIKAAHNKFGEDSEFSSNRVAANSLDLDDLVQPSANGIDSASERSELNVFLGASLGMSPRDVPDIGSLMISPVLRGSAVSAR